jgi:hypothetical protein
MNLHTQARRFSRRAVAAFVSLLVLAGLLAATVVPATGAEGDELLPDLVAEPVGQADTTATTDTIDGQTRLLLRFTSYVRNVGAGPLEVTGVNPVNGRISGAGLNQVLTHNHDTDADGALDKTPAPLPGAELKYETSDLHNHWHFQRAARYSLWNDAKSAEIDASSKVGFCFLDIGHGDPNYDPAVDAPIHFKYDGFVAPKTFGSSTSNCLAHLPSFPSPNDDVVPQRTQVDMGISTGWRDVYERTLPFQYIDVSNLQPGHFWLRSQVDPDNLLRESNDANTAVFASARSTVPGYIAKPIGNVNPFQVSGVKESTSTITLSQTSFRNTAAGTPLLGAPRYKIVEQPEHGTVAPPAGVVPDAQGWFAGDKVIYKKDGSYNGPDDFKFAVKQATSQFPLNPASAAVILQVGSGNGDTSVGISGAPAWLYTGQGAALTAAVNPDEDPTWAVDGIPGGDVTVGTIDSKGFYKAPAKVPADGKVRITATAADGAFDAVEIPIRARPVPPPTPDLPDPPLPPAGPTPGNPTTPVKPLSKPLIARNGRRLVVKFMPGKTGKLSITVRRKGKRVASCKVGVVRARAATCRFTLKKSKVKKLTGRLSVSGKLTVRGRTVAVRRTTVSLKVRASSAKIGPLCILTPIKN